MVALLYTFRRCPYAIRARMALAAAASNPEVREIVLRNKPLHMLQLSPKGTVPVLQTDEGRVVDESLEVMEWALSRNDPQGWLRNRGSTPLTQLLIQNDGAFKWALDRFKYPHRYPADESADAGARAESALPALEAQLSKASAAAAFLDGNAPGFHDAAIFPFIRQFVSVNPPWFATLPYPAVIDWHARMLQHKSFTTVMKKLPLWHPGAPVVWFQDTLL